MATPAAAPTEETVGDITYIRTDADLPPVAVIDRSPISGRHRMIFGLVAVLGTLAFSPGCQGSADRFGNQAPCRHRAGEPHLR